MRAGFGSLRLLVGAGLVLAVTLGPRVVDALVLNAAALETSKGLVTTRADAPPRPARLARAADYLERVPADDQRAESLRAHVALANGDLQAALPHIRSAGQDPIRGRSLNWRLGLLYLRQGWELDALAAWRAAGAGPSLHARAQEMEGGGQREEALRWYGFAVEVAPDSAANYHGLASAYERAGRVADSVRAYEEALAVFPEDETGYVLLGALLETRQGSGDRARALFRRCLERARESHGCLFRLALSSARAGELDEAADQITRYVHGRPDVPDGWYALGQIEAARGDCARAIEAYDRAGSVARDPIWRWRLPAALARTYWAMGRPDQARLALERALDAATRAGAAPEETQALRLDLSGLQRGAPPTAPVPCRA